MSFVLMTLNICLIQTIILTLRWRITKSLHNQQECAQFNYVSSNIGLARNGVTDEDLKYVCDNANSREIYEFDIGTVKCMKEGT
jgi:hypothetical protein